MVETEEKIRAGAMMAADRAMLRLGGFVRFDDGQEKLMRLVLASLWLDGRVKGMVEVARRRGVDLEEIEGAA